MSGLLSLIVFLHSVLTHYHWVTIGPSLPLHIYLDNKALLSIVSRSSSCPFSPSATTSSEFDLILQLLDQLSTLPLPLRFHHIKSHQDNHQHTSTLSLPAQANCRADQLASHGLSHCISCPKTPLYPAAQCTLSVTNATITRSHKAALYHHASASALQQYILRSRSWTDTDAIDWELLASFCTHNPIRLTFLLKWIHRLLPIGTVVHRRQSVASPFCPACGLSEGYLHNNNN